MVRQIPSAPRGVAGRTYTSLALLFAVALLVYYAIGEQVQGLIASYGSAPNGNSPQRGADEVADAVGGGGGMCRAETHGIVPITHAQNLMNFGRMPASFRSGADWLPGHRDVVHRVARRYAFGG